MWQGLHSHAAQSNIVGTDKLFETLVYVWGVRERERERGREGEAGSEREGEGGREGERVRVRESKRASEREREKEIFHHLGML